MPLNLYKIHPDPESCPWYEWDHENVIDLAWERYYVSYYKKYRLDKARGAAGRYSYRTGLVPAVSH